MKRIKKVLSVVLAVLMLLCSVPIVSNASSFSPRTTAPSSSNKYYFSDNIFYKSGYGMPNCTCYAYGRAYELLGSKPKLSTGNAGGWWIYNKNNGYYSYGQTPKLGAIAVWDKYNNNNGHVAVVEGISGNTITISESHYGGTFFNTRNIKSDSSDYLQSYRFLGYIYIIDAEPHKVDSNYGKNYTTYLKNPSGKTTVYTSCGIVASGHYISGNDPVTIHEVYTDGCCKVSYTTDSGATRTYYAKISDFKPKHTHDYSGARLYQPEHPHEISQRCVDYDSCGGFYWTGENYKDKSCPQCWDVDLSISKSSVTLNIGETATMLASISGVYPDTGKVYYDYDSSVVSYTMNKGELKITGLKAGSTNFTINIYSDLKTSSNVKHLASATVKVEVKAKTYTVKYDANGGSGSMSNSYHTYDVSKNLNANQFSRTGYTFLGWSTNKTAITATYTDKQSVKNLTSTNGTTVTLYAVWKANSYSVGYDPNGGKGEIGKSAHTYDVAKNLNANQFTRAGYTFLGWSTNKNAITATYTDKQSVKNLASSYGAVVNLYAVWKPNTYTVKYDANNGSGSMSSSTFTYDVLKNLSANQFSRTGYTFLGWSTSKTATTATYTDKQSVKNLTTTNGETVTLYAVWKANVYSVKYEANDGSGNIKYSTHTYDVGTNLVANAFIRDGYTFLGWSTDENATTIEYTDKQTVKNLSTLQGGIVTLYAVWSKNSYTLKYDANGGINGPEDQIITGYAWISDKIPEKTGYTFLGWDALESATNVQFNPGDGIIILADTSVYAVWKKNTYTIKYDANGGTGIMDDSVHTYDVWRTLNKNQFSRTGYTFLGWSTDKNAKTATYTNIQNVRNLTSTDDETIVLYAVWKVEKQKTPITVYFDGNGVELDWDSVAVPYEGKLSLSDIQTPVRKGYKFVRWSARDYDALLAIGNGIYPSLIYPFVSELPKEITLYAIWEEDASLTECEKNGHIEEVLPAVDPTCTQAGLTEGKKCSVCGEILVAQTEVAATGHTLVAIPGKPATETETGLTDGEKCSVCGTVTKEQEEIPVIEKHTHNYVKVVTAPTCTSQGYTTFTCSCGDSYVGEYVGYAQHTEKVIPATTPTCTATGLTEGIKCSVCNKILVEQRIVSALGHNEVSIPGKSATCTSSGLTEGKKCSVCNEILLAQKTIAAYGHNPGKWEVVKSAEIGKEGKEQQKCQICKVVLNEKILPALEPVGYEIGDVNNDGKITAADARTVLRASAKLETLDENAMVAADVNKDKKITAADARTILRVSAKLESF